MRIKNHGKDKTYFRMSHNLKIAVHFIMAKIYGFIYYQENDFPPENDFSPGNYS